MLRQRDYTNEDTIDQVDPTALAPPPEDLDPVTVRRDLACRELVNNNFDHVAAYKKVFGCTDRSAQNRAKSYFRTPEAMARVKELVYGTNAVALEKQFAIDVWHEWVNISPLDYFDDDGTPMTVAKLKKLPYWLQRAIKDVKVTRKQRTLTSGDVIVTETVEIKTVDKEQALQLLAKAHSWITEKHEVKHDHSSLADIIAVANQRMMNASKVIEGEAKQILADAGEPDGEG